MMTKSDTIEAILTLNPTAARPFLSEFSTAELTQYLNRLSTRPVSAFAIPCLSEADSPVLDRSAGRSASGAQ